jgi:hypothetical protein
MAMRKFGLFVGALVVTGSVCFYVFLFWCFTGEPR